MGLSIRGPMRARSGWRRQPERCDELKEREILDKQGTVDSAVETKADPPRKPYEKPELVRWGSLRELTLGSVDGLESDLDFTGSGGV